MSLIKVAKLFNSFKRWGKEQIKQKGEEVAISSFANSVNNLRRGRVIDNTFINNNELTKYQKYRNMPIVGKFIKHFENDIIEVNGKVNINNLEKHLNRIKKLHTTTGNLSKKPLVLYGGVGGAAIGALKIPDKDNSRQDNIIKGTMTGGILGYGIKKSSNKIHNALSPLAISHKKYFKNNYIKDRIINANNTFGPSRHIGKLISNLTTMENK